MKKVFTCLIILSTVFIFSISSQAAPKVVIKTGHGLTEASAQHLGWEKFKQLVEERSKGEIACEIYPNQQIGGDREMTEGVQLGSITACSPSSSPTAAFQKDLFVLDAPFMFANRKEAFDFLDGKFGQLLLARLESINLKGVAFWENGFRNLTNSRNAVRIPDDVKGLKLRTMENAIHLAAWKALGANPTPMAFGELFTALQQKTVDGQENPFGQIYDNKFFEVQPFITKSQHVYTPYVVFFNKDFWEELSPQHREIIESSMKEATAYQRKVAEELDDKSAEALKAAGRDIVELTAEEREKFRKGVAEPVAAAIKERVSPEVFAMYEEYMKNK